MLTSRREPNSPTGFCDAAVVVQEKLLRQYVNDFAVRRYWNRLSGADDLLHFFGGDFLVIPLDCDGAMRIETLEVISGRANGHPIHRNARFRFGLVRRLSDGCGRFFKIHDDTLFQSARIRVTGAEHLKAAIGVRTGNHHADLCCSDIQSANDSIIFTHVSSVPLHL